LADSCCPLADETDGHVQPAPIGSPVACSPQTQGRRAGQSPHQEADIECQRGLDNDRTPDSRYRRRFKNPAKTRRSRIIAQFAGDWNHKPSAARMTFNANSPSRAARSEGNPLRAKDSLKATSSSLEDWSDRAIDPMIAMGRVSFEPIYMSVGRTWLPPACLILSLALMAGAIAPPPRRRCRWRSAARSQKRISPPRPR
jgi:hypothetical protein